MVISNAPVTLDRKSRLHLLGQYLGCLGSRLFQVPLPVGPQAWGDGKPLMGQQLSCI